MNAFSPRSGGEGPIPDFAKAIDALAATLAAIAPVARKRVSEIAEEHRFVSSGGVRTKWRNSVAAYMVEPMDMTDSRRFKVVAFCGPARSVKSESLINNVIAHRILCRPRDMRLICPNGDAARSYSLSKLTPMLLDSPDLSARLLPGRLSDTLFEKRFAGNMRLTIGAPTPANLSMVDLPDMLFTDYDRMDDDIGGEGSPFVLGSKRTQTFGTLGMTVVESSPGKPLLDETFRTPVDAPHMAPPCTGILDIYNMGTRGLRYWHCDHCGERFEPDFDRLVCPSAGDDHRRSRAVELMCPHCGGLHEQARRRALDADGMWLHESADGSLVTIDGAVRETEIASYWLKGPHAVFQPWAQLMEKYLAAKEAFERTGLEENLKATINVDQAKPYKPRAQSADVDLSADTLRDRPARVKWRLVPAEARFLTAQVDVQDNRFVVQVDAWGVGLERWLIDRYDLFAPPADAPVAAGRAISPPLYREDWHALDAILTTSYPVAGSTARLLPAAMICDSAGSPGVTEKAYLWWRRAQKKFGRRRAFLVKGLGGVNRSPRAYEREPEKINQQRATKANPRRRQTVNIVFAASDVLKDEVAISLGRVAPGPGAYHLSSGLPNEVFVEMAAERRSPEGWDKKAGQRRNEAFDLAYYGKALVIVLGGEKIDWESPPTWAAPLAQNAYTVAPEAGIDTVADEDAPEATTAAEPVPSTPLAAVIASRRGRRVRSRGWGS